MKALFILSLMLCCIPAFGQRKQDASCSDSLTVGKITISPVKRTKEYVILRELALQTDRKICRDKLADFLKAEESKLLNTDLFIIAGVRAENPEADTVNFHIELKEKWYLYPIPLLDMADRNFSEWWSRGGDPGRLNYGMKLRIQNFRGRNEDLRFDFQLGFTQSLELTYKIPYIDAAKTTGLEIRGAFANNKSAAYGLAEDGSLAYVSGEKSMQRRMRFSLTLNKRSRFYNTHGFRLGIYRQTVGDTVLMLNPDYHSNKNSEQNYAEIAYVFHRDRRDNPGYPLKGLYTRFSFAQQGLGFFNDVNRFEIRLLHARFFQLNERFYASTSLRGMFSFPERQPFNLLKSFGYNQNLLRGYELRVINARSFLISKNTLRFKLFSVCKNWSGFIPIEQFSTVPIAAYFKIYFDAAYAGEQLPAPGDSTAGRPQSLWGTGAGFDLVTYYNMNFRFEYSINKEGEKGLFIGVRTDF